MCKTNDIYFGVRCSRLMSRDAETAVSQAHSVTSRASTSNKKKKKKRLITAKSPAPDFTKSSTTSFFLNSHSKKPN